MRGSRTSIHAQIACRDPAFAPLRPYWQTPSRKLLARQRCQCSGSQIKQKYAALDQTNSKLSSDRGSSDFDAPRRDGNPMFNSTARDDAKPKLVQGQPQPLLSFATRIVDPNGHYARRSQTTHEPVERRFQCFDRAVAPSDHGHVIVTLGQAARSCAECVDETQTPQLEQHVARRMTRDQKSICPSCPR